MISKTSVLTLIFISLISSVSQARIAQVPMIEVNGDVSLDANVVDWIDGYPIVENLEGGYSVIIEQNDAGEGLILSLDEYLENKGENFLSFVANYFNFKKTFQTVTSHITVEMEKRFETFIIVNVDFRDLSYGPQQIPSQHMRILRKAPGSQWVFLRDDNEQIIGFQPGALGMGTSEQPAVPAFDCLQGQMDKFGGRDRGLMEPNGLFKVSSGAGRTFSYTPWTNHDAYLDTPTGVYRFNDSRNAIPTRGRSWNSGRTATFRSMYFPIYFDLNYPNGVSERNPLGQESALAMHGTGHGSYGRLGSQASHGCVRTHQQVSWCVKNHYYSLDNSWSTYGQLRAWNDPHGGPLKRISFVTPFLETRVRLKSEIEGPDGVIVKEGSDGLFIIFYGYDEDLETGVPVEI